MIDDNFSEEFKKEVANEEEKIEEKQERVLELEEEKVPH